MNILKLKKVNKYNSNIQDEKNDKIFFAWFMFRDKNMEIEIQIS